MTDPFMLAAIEEAEAGLDASSVAATIAACSREARRFMPRSTRSNEVGVRRPWSTGGRSSTRRFRHAPCAVGAVLPYGIPNVVIGENVTFRGEEELLRLRGVELTILQDQACIDLMMRFIQSCPDLWNEDIGV